MARPFKRGKNWYIYVTHKGQRIRKSIGISKSLTQKYQDHLKASLVKDEFQIKENDCTITDLFAEYIKNSSIAHRRSTTGRYLYAIRNFELYLANFHPKIKLVSDLDINVFEGFKQFRVTIDPKTLNSSDDEVLAVPNNCRKGKSKTVNYELKTLRAIFSFGVKRKMCDQNPAREIQLLKVNDSKPPRFLSQKECQLLLQNCGDEFPKFFILLNTGIRLGELLYLQWRDVNFARKRLKIQAKDGWLPKTSEREIPLNEATYDLLLAIKPKACRKSEYIFPGKNRESIARELRKKIELLCREHDLDHFRIHDLRHTFASHLVMKGVDLATVQRLLGHNDIQTTMIYAHLAPDHLAHAVERLDYGVPQFCPKRRSKRS